MIVFKGLGHFTQWLACKQRPFITAGRLTEATRRSSRDLALLPHTFRDGQPVDDWRVAGGHCWQSSLTARVGSVGTLEAQAVPDQTLHSNKSLDGFVFALNKEGRFLYISETVSIYLGLSQDRIQKEECQAQYLLLGQRHFLIPLHPSDTTPEWEKESRHLPHNNRAVLDACLMSSVVVMEERESHLKRVNETERKRETENGV
ncbi:neuronal PAS domain-containing protein 3 isoform X5 [Tachysurus ichikawai]